MRLITQIMPYYRNPKMLAVQLDHIAQMPGTLRPFYNFIIVDDGSPEEALAPAFNAWSNAKYAGEGMLPPWEFYRIKVDVRWNWIAARNLAIHQCKTDWFFMSDIDHLLPYNTLERLMREPLDPGCAYKFRRQDAHVAGDGSVWYSDVKEHPNTWCMTKDLFNLVGGYDERWSGFYGSDGEFRDRIIAAARKVIILEEHVIRVEHHVISDSETRHYARKQPEDVAHKRVMRAAIAKDPQTRRLTFPWERLT